MQCALDHFARVYARLRQRATEKLLKSYHTVLCIEERTAKNFVRQIGQRKPKVAPSLCPDGQQWVTEAGIVRSRKRIQEWRLWSVLINDDMIYSDHVDPWAASDHVAG